MRQLSHGQEIWVYCGSGGLVIHFTFVERVTQTSVPVIRRTFTFWRFMIHIPLGSHEMRVSYAVNNGIEMNFYVPGRDQNMRWAAYSVSRG